VLLFTEKPSADIIAKQVGYVRPRNTRTAMYVGRVECCPLVSHVEYAPRDLLRLKKIKMGLTDGRTPSERCITPTARRGQRSNE